MQTETIPKTTPENVLKDNVICLTNNVLGFRVNDKESYDISLGYLVPLTDMRKRIAAFFEPLKKSTFAAHKKLTMAEKKELESISKAEAFIRAERSSYKVEQDRITEKLRQELEKKAKKEADKERERLLKKAANAPEAKQEEILAKAEDVYEAPVFVEKLDKQAKTLSGGTSTWVNDIEVTVGDTKLLCGAVAAGKVPESVVEFKKLKAWTKMNDIKPGQIPGLEIKATQRESVR